MAKDGKSISRSILENQSSPEHDLTETQQSDNFPESSYRTINGESLFHFMEPSDFERIFKEADKDSSNSLTKDELLEFKSQAQGEPQLQRAAQMLIDNYDGATDLVKSNYDIFDDRFTAKHYKSDPVAGILSRQDFDMLNMVTQRNRSSDYTADDFQSEWQRNSRACLLFSGTASMVANAILTRRTPILALASIGVGVVTAALGSAYLFNDYPMLREHKQRQRMIESWELQIPIK